MPRLSEIRKRVAEYRPQLKPREGMRCASVALVLTGPEDDPRIVFIERARREGDPWSGQMAFPGGRVDPEDSSERVTAERETQEEVGLELVEAAYLGRIDDQEGRPKSPSGGIVISAHVYEFSTARDLFINEEVQEAFWFPLAGLVDPDRHVAYRHPGVESMEFPGIALGETPGRHVVWGLTYRFLEIFLEIVGDPMPSRWSDLEKL